MPRTILEFMDVFEEDIGDISPSLSAPSTAWSSTTGSPNLGTTTATPLRPSFPPGFNVPQIVTTLLRNKSLSQLSSPSSPTGARPVRPVQLSRSQTLPRVFLAESKSPRSRESELDELEVNPETVEKMQRWIIGIAIVDFDLDDGPVIDGIYPPLKLLPAELETIAFSSLPDSFQFDQGSQSHSFRVREQLGATFGNKRPRTKDGFIYGHSHFTQQRDPTSKRGYKQRSVVILTQHQYPGLFSSLLSIFGPLFQRHGIPMLEAACHNIATWFDPTPGETLELGFLGSVLRIELPHTIDEQQLTNTLSFDEEFNPKLHILASSTPFSPPPLLLFEASLSHLWSLWECLVLCEPVLVFGTSPTQTSQAIWWLRDLLRPIPLAGDIRPYFTMQDGDHSLLVNKLPPKAGVLLGVTNPFFEKSCAHWPHILSLGCRTPIYSGRKTASLTPPAGPVPGWKTKTHKRYISKDRVLLKRLEMTCSGNDREKLDASLALRRHFCSRTTELITPLARYLNTLIPSPTEVHNARTSKHTLRLKPFNSDNFLASLKAHGSTLPFRSTSKRTEFYERWLKTPGFGLWLGQQERIVQGVLMESVERIGNNAS